MEFNTKLSKLISVYIINHNIIFKGSIGDFIKEYNKYYENIDVIVNDKGKVILE